MLFFLSMVSCFLLFLINHIFDLLSIIYIFFHVIIMYFVINLSIQMIYGLCFVITISYHIIYQIFIISYDPSYRNLRFCLYSPNLPYSLFILNSVFIYLSHLFSLLLPHISLPFFSFLLLIFFCLFYLLK